MEAQSVQGRACPKCGLELVGRNVCPNDGTKIDPAAESVMYGKYEFIRLVGTGGMSSVYLANHLLLNRPVAIKTLHAHLAGNEKTLKRFRQEAQLISDLSHPNIIGVRDFGVMDGGEPFIVMDYVEGRTLASVIENESPIDFQRAIDMFKQLAGALSHAHARGVTHRDLKPSNVIVTQEAGEERLKIIDFGIARFVNDDTPGDMTKSGEIFGSPHYMSPEQCMGQRVDGRSDIYSLGCLMYEVLTGSKPFVGTNAIETVFKQMHEAPPEIRTIRPQIRPGLESIIRKTLAKDPEQRYQTADAIVADLDTYGTSEHAVHDVRSHRSMGLNKTMAMSLSFVLVVAVGVVLLSRPDSSHKQAAPAASRTPEHNTAAPADPSLIAETNLNLSDQQITPGVLATLDRYPSLRWVQFERTNLSDRDIEIIARKSSLEMLDVRETQVGDAGLQYALQLPRLSALYLDSTRISNHGMVYVGQMRKLDDLSLAKTAITDEGFRHVVDLKSLRQLDLSELNLTDSSIPVLKSLPNLQGLNLGATNFSARVIDELPPSVSGLGLNHLQITDKEIKHLAKLPKLVSLGLNGCPITDAGMADLSKLPKLNALYLSNTKITLAGLKRLIGLPLKTLRLSRTGADDSWTPTIAKLQRLQELELDRTGVTVKGLTTLSGLPALRNLSLRGTTIGDESVETLATFPALQQVNLRYTNITRKGINELRKANRELDVIF